MKSGAKREQYNEDENDDIHVLISADTDEDLEKGIKVRT